MTNGEWPKVALDQVAELNPRLAETLMAEDKVSFVPMSAVSAETAGITDEETRTYAEVAKGYTPFMSGDVLVAKITPCFENGKIVQAQLTHRAGFGSTEFHVVRPRAKKLDARYTLHFLRLGRVRLAGERRMTGSAGQRRVPENFLAKIEIPLPPLAEQRRIAEVLDRAEALRAKRRAAIAQLDSLTQALFLDLFGDPSINPKGLRKQALEQITLNITDGKHGDCRPSAESGYFFVSVKDIKDGQIDYSGARQIERDDFMEVHKRTRLEEGDVLITNSGTIGKTAVVAANPQLDRTTFQKSVAIVKPNREKLESLYLRTSLDMCVAKLSRASSGSSQKNLLLGELRSFEICVPQITLQREFTRRVGAVEKLKTAQRASLAELDALFATLQHRAFRGEL
jgi:type I restriction enzyme S subunit